MKGNGTIQYGVRLCIFISMFQTLAACSSAPTKGYEGEERRISEVALIMNGVAAAAIYDFSQKGPLKTGFSFRNGFVTLYKIDGIPAVVDSYYYQSAWDGAVNAAVLPGKRKLSLILTATRRSKTKGGLLRLERDLEAQSSVIEFNAEIGHSYLLSFLQDDTQWTPVVLDLTAWKKAYPPHDLTVGKDALIGPGVMEWIQGKPIRPFSSK